MTINVNNSVVLTESLGHRTHSCCKPVINRTTGETYASALDAAEVLGVTGSAVSTCCRLNAIRQNKKARKCNGNELEYLNRTSGNVDSLTKRIQQLEAQVTALKADAAIGRAIREEQEAKDKAKRRLLDEITRAEEELTKATAKYERRQRLVERKEAEMQNYVARLMEAEKEKGEAELHLLELQMMLEEDDDE